VISVSAKQFDAEGLHGSDDLIDVDFVAAFSIKDCNKKALPFGVFGLKSSGIVEQPRAEDKPS
jgi:hypothetical protein